MGEGSGVSAMPEHTSSAASDVNDTSDITIRPFDSKAAGEEEFQQLADFHRRMVAEREPDDPPPSDAESTAMWRNPPDFYQLDVWLARTPAGELVGVAWGAMLLTEENQHLMQCSIEVLPDYRRRGIGRRLLRELANDAVANQRRLLIVGTTDRVPAGVEFLRRIGATPGVETRISQLRMSELNRPLLREWLDRAKVLEDEFELGFWPGAYPTKELTAIARLTDVMNQAPHDDLEIEDVHMTPEMLRQAEKMLLARGGQRWTYYVRERESGAFAGFSDVFRHDSRPAYAQVGSTGVFPAFRNRGLGRWLKAAMTDYLLREHPEVEYVRTQNANSNAPMRRINDELGFKLYRTEVVWQVETDKVLEYLGE